MKRDLRHNNAWRSLRSLEPLGPELREEGLESRRDEIGAWESGQAVSQLDAAGLVERIATLIKDRCRNLKPSFAAKKLWKKNKIKVNLGSRNPLTKIDWS
jgi:hypothetical protein